MEVTNLAEEYYRWVADGESQASRLYRAQWQAPEPREFWICPPEKGRTPYGVIHCEDNGHFVKEGFIHVREVL